MRYCLVYFVFESVCLSMRETVDSFWDSLIENVFETFTWRTISAYISNVLMIQIVCVLTFPAQGSRSQTLSLF